jgi:hypothetical protein
MRYSAEPATIISMKNKPSEFVYEKRIHFHILKVSVRNSDLRCTSVFPIGIFYIDLENLITCFAVVLLVYLSHVAKIGK